MPDRHQMGKRKRDSLTREEVPARPRETEFVTTWQGRKVYRARRQRSWGWLLQPVTLVAILLLLMLTAAIIAAITNWRSPASVAALWQFWQQQTTEATHTQVDLDQHPDSQRDGWTASEVPASVARPQADTDSGPTATATLEIVILAPTFLISPIFAATPTIRTPQATPQPPIPTAAQGATPQFPADSQ